MPSTVSAKTTAPRSLLARLGLALAALVGLALLLLIAVLLINVPDRSLSASANAWLAGDGRALARTDSIGASLWALDAPAGVDASTVGAALRQAYLARDAKQIARGDWNIKPPYRGDNLALPFELGCLDPASACVSSALGHSQLVRDLARQRSALLARLDQLDSGSVIEELPPPAEPHAPAEQFAALVSGNSLALALASVDIGDAHLAEGSARLERMTRIARQLLAGCNTLACKLSASGMLRRSLLVYSELMNQTSATDALAASLLRVDAPMTETELDLSPALRFELTLAHHLDMSLAAAASDSAVNREEMIALRLTPLFFKPDATFNLQAELADIEAPVLRGSALSYGQQGRASFAAFARRADLIGATSLASFYNPLGRVLASQLPSLEDAVTQLHDVEVLQTALRAKALLLTGHVGAGEAQAFLNQHVAALADPYTGQALQFDATKSALTLSQHGARPVASIRVGLKP